MGRKSHEEQADDERKRWEDIQDEWIGKKSDELVEDIENEGS